MSEIVKDWKEPRLVQRFTKPGNIRNPFSYEAIPYHGLNEEEISLLEDVLSFDNMGSDEYESGAIPKALHTLGEYRVNNVLIKGQLDLNDSDKTSFYICAKPHEDDVKNFIKDQYSKNPTDRLRDPTRFRRSMLDGYDESVRDYLQPIGWLELHNPFMFFKDEKMYEGMLDIYDILQ